MNAPEDPRIWQGLRAHLDELGSLRTPPAIRVVLDRRRYRQPSRAVAGLAGLGAVALVGLLFVVLRPAPAPITGATPTSSTSSASEPSEATATAALVDWGELIGRPYAAVRATKGGQTVALVPEAPLGLGFTDATHFGASFGCNGGGGDYEIRDGRFETANVYMTLKACLGERGELEGWYYAFLLSGPTITREAAGFVLTSGDIAVTYLDARLAPSPPVRAPTWVAITGPEGSFPGEELVLEMGGMAWNGFAGVASIPTSDAVDVRLVGRETCRTYAEFIAKPGSSTIIRFSKDGQIATEDWTGREIDAGPALPHERMSDCPVT